jgi:acyl-CoA dehydrogenase
MIKRRIFSSSEDSLRLDVANFLDHEIAPHYGSWEKDGAIPRHAWINAGNAGLLCRTAPKSYGGQGASFLESVVIAEELGKRRFSGFLTFLQSDIVAPYFLRLGDDQQKEAYLPGLCSGSKIGALAVTEPQSGSEVGRMCTTISRTDAGFVVNGRKTHISNGYSADVVLVAGRNGSGMTGAEAEISLLIVDTDTPGIRRRPIAKSGMRALDTCEFTFENTCVPARALLGRSGKGLFYFFTLIGLERLMLAIYAQASAVAILQELLTFCDGRKTSAGTILDYQFVHCRLADLYGECTVNQAFIDACIVDQARGRYDPHAASLAKLRSTESLKSVALLAVQLRGAQGVSGAAGERVTQDLIDSCVQSIWGGASEVLRDAIGKGLMNGI